MINWWGGRKEDGTTDPETSSSSKPLNKGKKTPIRRRLGRPVAAEPTGDESESVSSQTPTMYVAETVSGIEVSFSSDKMQSSQSLTDETVWPAGMVMSLHQELLRRRRVHRGQFRTDSTTSSNSSTSIVNSRISISSLIPSDLSKGKHRVPLFSNSSHFRCRQSNEVKTTTSSPSYADALFLLRSLEIRHEEEVIQDEIRNTSAEVHALEGDRDILLEKCKTLHEALHSKTAVSATPPPPSQTPSVLTSLESITRPMNCAAHRQLLNDNLSASERNRLQERRGVSLTVSIHHPAVREAFLTQCGCIASSFHNNSKQLQSSSICRITPQICRDGESASFHHVSLLPRVRAADHNASTKEGKVGFFISCDKPTVKSCVAEHIPDRLYRRMKEAGLDPKHSDCDVLYLATGPMGSYFAEFRSGEYWWGSAEQDTEFDAICREWDVSRVAFGPCTSLLDQRIGTTVHQCTSWIIVSRDGRVAWKNIPARLHNKFERRLASEMAPIDVSLGPPGIYFVRFLDGTTDFCLSAAAATACRDIESQGLSITSMSLHPDLSHDFIIRHT